MSQSYMFFAADRCSHGTTMILKILIILSIVVYCDCVFVYSSFWAPVFNPRLLQYRVNANFDQESGKHARDMYETRYGYRGENLIANLGNGKGPSGVLTDLKVHGDVKFHYTTYSGVNDNKVH